MNAQIAQSRSVKRFLLTLISKKIYLYMYKMSWFVFQNSGTNTTVPILNLCLVLFSVCSKPPPLPSRAFPLEINWKASVTFSLRERGRRLRKPHEKKFALLQTLPSFSHLVQFGKYWWIFSSWILKDCIKVPGKKKENCSLVFTSSTKLGTMKFHVVGKEMYKKAWCTCKVVVLLI